MQGENLFFAEMDFIKIEITHHVFKLSFYSVHAKVMNFFVLVLEFNFN